MAGLRIDTENPTLLWRGKKGLGQFEGEFVRSDLLVDIGSLRRGFAVLADDHPLQIGPVLARPHTDRATLSVVEEADGVDPAGVDALEVDSDELLQPAGAGDRVRDAVLAAEVKIVQPVRALLMTVGDLVKFVLQCRGEVVVDQSPEMLLEQPGHSESHPRRDQCGALLIDVATILNGLDDRGIRRRAADPEILQCLDQ